VEQSAWTAARIAPAAGAGTQMLTRPLPTKHVAAVSVVETIDAAAAAKGTQVVTEREAQGAGSEKNREEY